MARKKHSPQPVTASEPARPEEQLRYEETSSPPPRQRPSNSARRSGERKSFSARSARERRATRSSTSARRSSGELSQDVISEMLENPTIEVTEDELRQEYGFVIADLRSMGLLSVALIVALVALAEFLPK